MQTAQLAVCLPIVEAFCPTRISPHPSRQHPETTTSGKRGLGSSRGLIGWGDARLPGQMASALRLVPPACEQGGGASRIAFCTGTVLATVTLGTWSKPSPCIYPSFLCFSDVHGQPFFVGRAASVAGQRRVRWTATGQKKQGNLTGCLGAGGCSVGRLDVI